MDKTLLVKDDELAGLQLVRLLDESGLPIDGAFWFQPPEWVNWRLFIVTPWVDSPGPRAVYRHIELALQAAQPAFQFDRDSIVVVSPSSNVFRELSSVLTIRPGNMDVDWIHPEPRADGWSLTGEQIRDAFVYRLRVPSDIARAAGRRQSEHQVRRLAVGESAPGIRS